MSDDVGNVDNIDDGSDATSDNAAAPPTELEIKFGVGKVGDGDEQSNTDNQ